MTAPLTDHSPVEPAPVAARTGLVPRALGWLIRGYQHVTAGRPSPCRYFPSCSSYALEAVQVHGAARGSWLAVRRVCRCNPWGGHGIDFVPERKAH